jgi:acyl-CoA reductase-like NAD-dependent aldehyde dehydrogenase
MSIAQEEVFGPVAPIIIAADEFEAIKFANDSEYGLGANFIRNNYRDRIRKLK